MDLDVDSDGDGNTTNDIDGDGIWDTAAIVIGMHHDPTEAGFRRLQRSARTFPRCDR